MKSLLVGFRKTRARRKQNWIGWAYRHLYPNSRVRALARTIGLGGPGNFFEIGCSEMASEAFLGPKTSLEVVALVLAW